MCSDKSKNTCIPLDPGRLERAKSAYTVRRIPLSTYRGLASDPALAPRPGDVVLARIDKLGKHTHLELTHGRRARLFPGDEVVLCYGNRYASDQFEALVPDALGECHLVAAGGIAAQALSWHDSISRPTRITVLGYLTRAGGRRLNLRRYASTLRTRRVSTPPYTLLVVGCAMNSGKTTTAMSLIRGAARAGLKVGAAKLTGTGAGGDVWAMLDAGARPVMDFTDAGFASTYRLPLADIKRAVTLLTHELYAARVDLVVLEIADGLYQNETAALLTAPWFHNLIDGVVLAAGDALGASAGVEWLTTRQWPILCVSGTLTRSPLMTRETEQAARLPVYSKDALSEPEILMRLIQRPVAETLLVQAV